MKPPTAATPDQRPHPVILFDAMCLLCSANAQFVLRHDRHGTFRLASMQSEAGAALYREHGIDPADPSTLLMVDGDRVKTNSDAVIAIYERLGFPWSAARILRVVPGRLRDPIYLLVARNRYRLFGRRETCWMPQPEYRDRML